MHIAAFRGKAFVQLLVVRGVEADQEATLEERPLRWTSRMTALFTVQDCQTAEELLRAGATVNTAQFEVCALVCRACAGVDELSALTMWSCTRVTRALAGQVCVVVRCGPERRTPG